MSHQNPRRKKQKLTPEAQFRSTLDQCSKSKDLSAAISLYESSASPTLTLNNLNSFLYICSEALSCPDNRQPAIDFGFKLFHIHNNENLKPNEATLTAVARLAAANGDGDYAFELAKSVKKYGVSPKLRTFTPALNCFCGAGAADKAYEVEEHVVSVGLQLEEPELAALLKVSVEAGKKDRVYGYLHNLRRIVRGVEESTMSIIESWFGVKKGADMDLVSLDQDQIKEAIVRNGGGWHGLGWLGKGEWVLQRTNVASDGRCCACLEQLVCVDTDRAETDKFAQSIASLAMEREHQSNFKEFQDWLEQHSGYETLVDGANVGLYQQNFAQGGFSIEQLDAIVKEVHSKTQKWPLVVLHNKRVRSLLEDASKRELINDWMDQGVLYGTPYGSNDDWYWLYAAVKLKCLLVTNDEMRDHIFELLGNNFFFRWKERHQVRYTCVKGSLKLIMPPSYSVIIQESEKGSWHIPLAGEISDESVRTWLCAGRSVSHES
ncbi:proteinaceous RNase P 3 [Perilla frutescens var. hirtella]|uniref:ribonuclease P n=1 Tax=Perilla frutescens var. hirtella TaxID=608512 RepID=A0AAD4IW21_PERFH|nr:proteinaceous RNase P 3 [Perilla frutescens var. hirtella]